MAAAAKPAPVVGPSMRDFTILQALGKGSYGSVFKAVRKSDGFKCVVAFAVSRLRW
jgi:serine/threonine protein kinase